MFITYISTELKQNLKSGEINEDGSNLRELLMPNHYDEPEDLFVPDNKLLIDLNVSILYCLVLSICNIFCIWFVLSVS